VGLQESRLSATPSDGYTFLMGWDALLINPALYPVVPNVLIPKWAEIVKMSGAKPD